MDVLKIKLIVLTVLILIPLSGSLFYIVRTGIHQWFELRSQPSLMPAVMPIIGRLALLGTVFIVGLFIGFMILWFFWFRELSLPLYIKLIGIIITVPYLGGLATVHALSKGVEFGLKTSKIKLDSGDKV